jgi:hypothetical protein
MRSDMPAPAAHRYAKLRTFRSATFIPMNPQSASYLRDVPISELTRQMAL